VSHVPSIRRNIVGIGVPNLDDQEVAEMISIAESSGNVRFDTLARKRLTKVSGGLPYLVGLLGQHAVLEAADAGDKQISQAHIDRAVAVGCDEIASRLSLRCNYALGRLDAPNRLLIEHAALEATSNGGLIADPETTAEISKRADHFADILQPLANDPRGSWRFCEDGTASLVWLRHMQQAK
jgi:hypothetical protein